MLFLVLGHAGSVKSGLVEWYVKLRGLKRWESGRLLEGRTWNEMPRVIALHEA